MADVSVVADGGIGPDRPAAEGPGRMLAAIRRAAPPLLAALVASGCWGKVPPDAGPLPGGGLRPCPGSPNCVHTGLGQPEGTQPFRVDSAWAGRDPEALLDLVVEALLERPRTVMAERERGYLRAEATSLIFRFVDDVEVVVRDSHGTPGSDEVTQRELVVRSASRIGQSDLGVNRRRVRALRAALERRGVLHP